MTTQMYMDRHDRPTYNKIFHELIPSSNANDLPPSSVNNIITRPRANAIIQNTTKKAISESTDNSKVYGLSMNNWNKYTTRYKNINGKNTLTDEAIMNTLFVDLNNKQKYHTLKQKLKKNNMNLTNKPNIKNITNRVKRVVNKIEKKREANIAKAKKNRDKNKQQSHLAGKTSTELAPPVISRLNNYGRDGKIYNSLMQNIGKITPNIEELIRYIKNYSNDIQLTFIQKLRPTKLVEYAGKIDNLWNNIIEKNKLYFDKQITTDELLNQLKNFLKKIEEYKDKFNCKDGDEKARQDICKKFNVCIQAVNEIIKLH